MTDPTPNIEISAYVQQPAPPYRWEWASLAWWADEWSTAGDFSAWEDGEPIRLVGYVGGCEYHDEREPEYVAEGVVRHGRFCEE